MSCEHDCDRPVKFPAEIFNRAGLSRFGYRIGDYAAMRAHLLDQLVRSPALAEWSHLEPDEPGIALLEGAAVVGDILTFYAELYGNEAKLPTAAWAESVFDLVQLTGYRPAPGLGGETVFALEVEGDAAVVVPAGFAFQAQLEGAEKPAIFESAAAIEAYPAFGSFHLYRRRLGLQKIKGSASLDIARLGDTDALDARLTHGIEAGDRVLLMSGPLDPHEIVVVAETEEHLDRVTLHLDGKVQEDHPSEVTAFKIGRTFRHFGADAPRQFSTFREDPPKTIIHDTEFLRRTAKNTSIGANYSTLGQRHFPLGSEVDDLATGARVICVGEVVLPTGRNFAFVRRITKIKPRDVLWAGVTAPVTMLQLNAPLRADTIARGTIESLGTLAYAIEAVPGAAIGPGPFTAVAPVGPGPFAAVRTSARSGAAETAKVTGVIDAEAAEVALAQQVAVAIGPGNFGDIAAVTGVEHQDIRRLRIYETLSDKMILRAPPKQVEGKVADGKVSFFGTRSEAGALAGRRVMLAGLSDTPEDIIVAEDQPDLAAAPKGPRGDRRMWPIRLGMAPAAGASGFSETDPQVTVYGNLVDATEGESQPEAAIGSGDARAIFQTFAVSKAPLTYLADPLRAPPRKAELEIRVDGRLWNPVETFFDAAPDAEIYVIRQAGGGAVVQFGDGINGARLPSGKNNVTGSYRVGSGSSGALEADADPKAKIKLKPLRAVVMPGPVTGGAAPENMASARAAAPGRMQSLGRLVGLTDYEAEALALPGVRKVGAVFAEDGDHPAIAVTVLTEDESPEAVAAVEASLLSADRCRGPARHSLQARAGRRRYVHLSLLLGYDPAYRSADLDVTVTASLGALPKIAGEPVPESGLFSLDQRAFGQDVHISQAIAMAQSVDGVVWVKPVAFGKLSASSDDPADLSVPATPGLAARIGIKPNEVLALSAHHLTLSPASVSSDEECSK